MNGIPVIVLGFDRAELAAVAFGVFSVLLILTLAGTAFRELWERRD